MYTKIKTPQEIDAMRRSGRMLGSVLQTLKPAVRVGISTKELADIARKEVKRLGGEPAFLGYQGFPDVLCVSINDEIVHGIPSAHRIIAEGDIVSMDFGVSVEGMITDAAISVIAGRPKDKEAEQLVRTTEEALMRGIHKVKKGATTGDIAHAVQSVLEPAGYGIVRDLVGHGVGHHLHEEPNIPNYGYAGSGAKLEAGMTIAIEPMATLGSYEISMKPDGWTIVARDGSLSAHFEHTVLVTQTGVEILTTA